jgi:hypothetical protein
MRAGAGSDSARPECLGPCVYPRKGLNGGGGSVPRALLPRPSSLPLIQAHFSGTRR